VEFEWLAAERVSIPVDEAEIQRSGRSLTPVVLSLGDSYLAESESTRSFPDKALTRVRKFRARPRSTCLPTGLDLELHIPEALDGLLVGFCFTTGISRGIRRCRIDTDMPVEISMERSLEMIVALRGVLKAGATYAR
jgi:hypothetical protein